MLLIEAIEEIQEKSDNFLSIQSIIRKISTVRNQLLRKYGSDTVAMQFDLLKGIGQYPYLLPKDSIQTVLVEGVKVPYRQHNQMGGSRYYYFMANSICLYPVPSEDVLQGLTVLYRKTLVPLNENDLDAEVNFDMDYDMLVVYGALKDMTTGNLAAEYTVKYETLLSDYLQATANSEPEMHQIVLEGW